jgi:hypothetical protein
LGCFETVSDANRLGSIRAVAWHQTASLRCQTVGMADQWYGDQPRTGERWNVNLPAVVGVVFVFLVGVVIWVIASADGDDAIETTSGSTLPAVSLPPTVATTLPPTVPPTAPAVAPTTPLAPAPTTPVAAPATAAPTEPPAPPPPATDPPQAPPPTEATTTAATTTTTTRPPGPNGDLNVPGHPIQKPACDGGYITVVASAVGAEATAAALDQVLDRYSGSNYLRTDQTCPSLTPAIGGEPIYVVYLGPFSLDADACRARAQGPSGSYVRRLSNDLAPTHSVVCA